VVAKPGLTLQVLKRRCTAATKKGEPCTAPAMIGRTVCVLHQPGGATFAAKIGSIGERHGSLHNLKELTPLAPPKTPDDIVKLVSQTIYDLRAGKIDVRLAQGICSCTGPLLNALELRDLSEQLTRCEMGLDPSAGLDKDELDEKLSELTRQIAEDEAATAVARGLQAGSDVSGDAEQDVTALTGRFEGKIYG
jgi:hypothetical protein